MFTLRNERLIDCVRVTLQSYLNGISLTFRRHFSAASLRLSNDAMGVDILSDFLGLAKARYRECPDAMHALAGPPVRWRGYDAVRSRKTPTLKASSYDLWQIDPD